MTAHIFFKTSSREAKVHGINAIRRYNQNGPVKEVTDCKDFVLEPRDKYTFVGDGIVSVHGSDVLYVEFLDE